MGKVRNVKPTNTKIKIGGKERELRFDLNALAELEDAYGSIESAMNKAQEGSIKALRCIIWAGLLHEDENLKERQVGAWLDMQTLHGLTGTLEGAITSSLPEEAVSPNEVSQE